MDCQTVQDLSIAFLEGELSHGQTDQVAEHVEICEACAERLSHFDEQSDDLSALPPPADPRLDQPGFWDRMDAAVAEEAAEVLAPPPPPVPFWRRPLRVSPLGLLAYAAALMLAVGWGWMQQRDAAQATAQAEALGEELQQERRLAAQPPTPVRVEQYRPVSYTPRRGTF
jgi:anti-sigma factor RsiW